MGGAKGGWGTQPPVTSVENYVKTTTYFSFSFCEYNVNILGRVIHHWKGVLKTFPTVYYKPLDSKNFNWENQRKFVVV